MPMVTSASDPRGAVPVYALPLRQRCRARPDEICSSSHWAYGLILALMLVWCSSAHGTRVCSPTSMFLPRRLRGGSHTFEVGDEFALKRLSSSPSKTFNPAEKAVLSSVAGRSGTRAGRCTLDQLKERLQARLKGETLVQTRFVFPLRRDQHQVAVIGSWGDWMVVHDLHLPDSTPGNEEHQWETSVNLPVGDHAFKFVVDGGWVLGEGYEVVSDGVATQGNHRAVVVHGALSEEKSDARMVDEAIQSLEHGACSL